MFSGLVVTGNHNAEVVFAATKKTEFVAEAVVAEVLGLRWGLQIARGLNLSNIIFELDASLVVDCFKDLLSLSSIDHFIIDCKELFCSLANCSICAVSRSCNSAADRLAQVAKTIGSRIRYMGEGCLKPYGVAIFLYWSLSLIKK
ncbi:hypothetical protein TSUD_160260 [Trifolium subterraneum]|uniref:RNase H type-1 domain-containing protein n=1 Tax=Trifolium subterraneum TaxID=3900 RepID=A0A2Z6MZV0_TRISU|nr:hypothetical protein TSUD_160260 [Trifolium subterraneum]